MGNVRRFATSGKVELPQGVKRKTKLLYIHDIVNLIETHKIPKSIVLNLDQSHRNTFRVVKQLLQSRIQTQFQSGVFQISE